MHNKSIGHAACTYMKARVSHKQELFEWLPPSSEMFLHILSPPAILLKASMAVLFLLFREHASYFARQDCHSRES